MTLILIGGEPVGHWNRETGWFEPTAEARAKGHSSFWRTRLVNVRRTVRMDAMRIAGVRRMPAAKSRMG